MSRSFIRLRRALFGTCCAVVFGFGATQALASPASAALFTCSEEGQQACNDICRRTWGGPGYCNFEGTTDDREIGGLLRVQRQRGVMS